MNTPNFRDILTKSSRFPELHELSRIKQNARGQGFSTFTGTFNFSFNNFSYIVISMKKVQDRNKLRRPVLKIDFERLTFTIAPIAQIDQVDGTMFVFETVVRLDGYDLPIYKGSVRSEIVQFSNILSASLGNKTQVFVGQLDSSDDFIKLSKCKLKSKFWLGYHYHLVAMAAANTQFREDDTRLATPSTESFEVEELTQFIVSRRSNYALAENQVLNIASPSGGYTKLNFVLADAVREPWFLGEYDVRFRDFYFPSTLTYCEFIRELEKSKEAKKFEYYTEADIMLMDIAHLSMRGNTYVDYEQNFPSKHLNRVVYKAGGYFGYTAYELKFGYKVQSRTSKPAKTFGRLFMTHTRNGVIISSHHISGWISNGFVQVLVRQNPNEFITMYFETYSDTLLVSRPDQWAGLE